MDKAIKNAIIKSISLNSEDHGCLTAWLQLDYGGSCQGFGGYGLYLPKSFTHHKVESFAGHFIYRCCEIAGVTEWSKLVGKTIRVELSEHGLGGRILGIGHIVNDDWFYPKKDFEEAKMREDL